MNTYDFHNYYDLILELYEYTIYFNSAVCSVYILTNIFNLLWVLIPWFGKLSSVMSVYKKSKREAAKNNKEKPDDSKILGDLYHIYYKNRDLKLFLELLAIGSGVAPAISFMTLFDSVRRLKHHRQKTYIHTHDRDKPCICIFNNTKYFRIRMYES